MLMSKGEPQFGDVAGAGCTDEDSTDSSNGVLGGTGRDNIIGGDSRLVVEDTVGRLMCGEQSVVGMYCMLRVLWLTQLVRWGPPRPRGCQ